MRIEFGPRDLVGLTFAHSPMVEVVTSTMILNRPGEHWPYAAWRARMAPRWSRSDLSTLRAAVSGPIGYIPDFLTPVPPVARPALADELRVVAATPPERVAAELDAAWTGHSAPPEIRRFAIDPAGGLTELLMQVRRYFAVAIAPVWPRLRAVAEAEITQRALTAAERGPGSLLSGLHPTLDWDGSALRLASAKERHWGLDGHRLALLPAGFAAPRLHTMTEAPTGRALWYPPRGYGGLWDRPAPADVPTRLAGVLGSTRAAVLTLLTVPSSTGEVADALGLAPATASHHLTTLRDAGLIVGQRSGRRLRYLRTSLGDQLGGFGR